MYFITPVFNLTQLIQYNLEYNSMARLKRRLRTKSLI
jgi:hypothetical protein